MKDLAEILQEEGFSGSVHHGESMARHCSLKVGGRASLLVIPETLQDLRILLSALQGRSKPWMVLGSGTNVFFPEPVFNGCVVHLGKGFKGVEEAGETGLEAGAAAITAGILGRAARLGLSGLEFAAGIPGTIGGAIRMNAGAAGGDMAGAVTAIQVTSSEGSYWIEGKDLGFRYRRLALQADAVITGVRVGFLPSPSLPLSSLGSLIPPAAVT